jgi:hypothetical protein
MSVWLDRLRPHPHRGDVIAAGAVPLALAALLIDLRMTQWGVGARFVVVAAISVLLLIMGWLAPLEGEGPRPYHSILLTSGLLLAPLALTLLARMLGAGSSPGAGAVFWTFGLVVALGVVLARHANSAACTLIAALAGVVAIEAFVSWIFASHGLGTFRAMLLVIGVGYLAGAVRLRDDARRHAVALIDAAGVSALLIGLSYLVTLTLFGGLGGTGGLAPGSSGHAPFGWELYLLAAGFGLLAYAGVDREPGPAYLGVAVLVSFTVLAAVHTGRGSLVGWPLFLLAVGVMGLAIGLRPRRPLPPPPGPDNTAATIPLPEREE